MMWTKQAKRKLKKTAIFTLLLFVFQTAPPVQLWLPLRLKVESVSAKLYSTVSGVVIDAETGQGVSGATVGLHQLPPFSQVDKAVHFTQTDWKGRFRIKVVQSAVYDLLVLPPENYLNTRYPSPIHIISGKNIVGINVTVQKGGEISGVVKNSNDNPVSNLKALVITSAGTADTVTTDMSGKYRLSKVSPRTDVFVMMLPYGYSAIFAKQFVSVELGKTTEGVDFQLPSENGNTIVEGKITSARDGAPVYPGLIYFFDARIPQDISPIHPELSPDLLAMFSQKLPSIGAAEIAPDGRYRIVGLPQGNYNVTIFGAQHLEFKDKILLSSNASTVSNFQIQHNTYTPGGCCKSSCCTITYSIQIFECLSLPPQTAVLCDILCAPSVFGGLEAYVLCIYVCYTGLGTLDILCGMSAHSDLIKCQSDVALRGCNK